MGTTAKKTALITGASSGIGRAIALRFAQEGWRVLAHYNSKAKETEALCREIGNAGGEAYSLQFNVSDSHAVESALDQFLAKMPELQFDAVVNNAGIHIDGMAGLMSDEDFDAVIKTNLYGSFYVMRYALKRMIRVKKGVIVNVSSLAGQTGNAGQINYAASKAGLIAMTKSLAMELGKRNIRVNAVAPGLIETDMLKDLPHLDAMVARIPLGRLGKPEDVAGAISFLCSDDASYITGTTLSINGGLYPG